MQIIFGTSQEQIDTYLCVVLFSKKVDVVFDYDKNDDEILANINQTSFFEDEENKQTILINDATFLTSKTKKAIAFIKQLEESKKDIICTVVAKNEASFNNEAKKLEPEKAKVFDDKAKEVFLAKVTEGKPIKFDCETTKQIFIQKVKNDPRMLLNEVEKLQAYSSSGSEITANVLSDLIFETVDENIFNWLIKIFDKNKTEAIKMFDQMIQRKYLVPNIISVIASQLFDLKIQKQLKLKYSRSSLWDLSKQTGYPYFILKKNETILNNITLARINNMLNDLLIIDYNIKTMQVLPIPAFKLFILKDE